jgi:acyl-CoA reductase-like NAD-dependent aldehyde dehydrogenase
MALAPDLLTYDRLYIDGAWRQPVGTADPVTVVNPATEQALGYVPDAGRGDVDRAVAAARRAFDQGVWPRSSPVDRAGVLSRIVTLYERYADTMAELITAEMGCPITWSKTRQVPDPVAILRYYVDLAGRYTWAERRDDATGSALVIREPVGVVAAIVPWNMPQKTIIMKLAPALLAGCTVVVKPAAETPLDAMLLARVCDDVGLPAGVLNVVPVRRNGVVAEYLVAHPDVDKVAFTGSTAVGRRIAAMCGDNLRRVSLELGGKSAAIICDDADLDQVVPALKGASLANTGQICSAHTRLLVHRSLHDQFVDRLVGLVDSMPIGDPTDPVTEVGPLVSKRQRDQVERYIHGAVEAGATLVRGGQRPAGLHTGWYVQPTIFTGVNNAMPIAREEVFGPVLAVIPFDSDQEAVDLANDSPYGLDAGVWTSDSYRAGGLARQIRAGTVQVNGAPIGVNTPLGGYKDSGIGRELGPEGLGHYLETKAISAHRD